MSLGLLDSLNVYYDFCWMESVRFGYMYISCEERFFFGELRVMNFVFR